MASPIERARRYVGWLERRWAAICVATALTAIALRKRTKATVRPVRVALWLGFGLVVADLALKAVLAPLYRSLFQRFVAP